jgi:hypothetical protein
MASLFDGKLTSTSKQVSMPVPTIHRRLGLRGNLEENNKGPETDAGKHMVAPGPALIIHVAAILGAAVEKAPPLAGATPKQPIIGAMAAPVHRARHRRIESRGQACRSCVHLFARR